MKKVYLETFGCQMNVSDSERISTQLKSGGYEMTSDESAADVVGEVQDVRLLFQSLCHSPLVPDHLIEADALRPFLTK